jgi:hypothetical protein
MTRWKMNGAFEPRGPRNRGFGCPGFLLVIPHCLLLPSSRGSRCSHAAGPQDRQVSKRDARLPCETRSRPAGDWRKRQRLQQGRPALAVTDRRHQVVQHGARLQATPQAVLPNRSLRMDNHPQRVILRHQPRVPGVRRERASEGGPRARSQQQIPDSASAWLGSLKRLRSAAGSHRHPASRALSGERLSSPTRLSRPFKRPDRRRLSSKLRPFASQADGCRRHTSGQRLTCATRNRTGFAQTSLAVLRGRQSPPDGSLAVLRSRGRSSPEGSVADARNAIARTSSLDP